MRVGQRITMGSADDRDSGLIDSVNGVDVTVRWDSGVVTTQPISQVHCLDLMSGDDFHVYVVDDADDAEVSREIAAYLVETDDGRTFDGEVCG